MAVYLLLLLLRKIVYDVIVMLSPWKVGGRYAKYEEGLEVCMKRIEKRIAGIIMALMLVLAGVLECASVVKTAKADDPWNMYYDFDDDGNVVEKYFIAEGANATDCEIISPGDTSSQPEIWVDGTTYLFGFNLNEGNEEYTYSADRVEVEGDVKLIILNGCTLTVSQGINVPENSSLTICGPGTLNCCSHYDYAAIGSESQETSGSITIIGAIVNAESDGYSAGIGGGDMGSCGTVTIAGDAKVYAKGGIAAAGIGSGCESGVAIGTIIISGGTVTAEGGREAAGIGAGSIGGCGTIIITGGTVNAKGGAGGAGIGGGFNSCCGSITISGGEVTAVGGEQGYTDDMYSVDNFFGGAGIGAGYGTDSGIITITGGTVTATGGEGAAGIGGAFYSCEEVTITDGTVTAVGGDGAAGIGGGLRGDGGKITISGGEVTATGGSVLNLSPSGGAGIGGGYQGDANLITISDGVVTAYGVDGAAGIGGGYEGDCEKIAICGGEIHAYGGDLGGAGIGGGACGDVGEITITDGTITANGGDLGGAGIGGGYHAAGGKINISGGQITAGGGSFGAGIGSGEVLGQSAVHGTQTITISGGVVVANGGLSASGIGSGNDMTTPPDRNNHCGTISITGGSVFASAGGSSEYHENCDSAAIGGYFGEGDKIEISGGTVTAYVSESGQTGIGGVYDSIRGADVRITGGTVYSLVSSEGIPEEITGIGDGYGYALSEAAPGTVSIDFTDDSSVKAFNYRGAVTLLSDAVILETAEGIEAGLLDTEELAAAAGNTLIKGPLSGIKLNSANIEFKGLIRMRMAFKLPDDFVGSEDIFVVYYQEGEQGLEEVTRIALKDGTPITGKSGVSYGYYCPIRTKQYADNLHIRILDANGKPLVYTAGSSWTGNEYTYSARQYAEAVLGPNSTSSQTMKDLAQAFTDYGTAAKIYFDYGAENCMISDRVTAVTANDMGDSITTIGDTATSMGLSISANLDFKEDNSLYIYFTLPAGKTARDYVFTIRKGDTVQSVTAALVSGRKYQVVVRNIAAKSLADFYEFTIKDNATKKALTVRASAISYAKSVLVKYADSVEENIKMINLAKALYLYNQAAIAYFGQ